MIRITGGALGGRTVRVSRAGVRPTQERVREAVFSSIGAAITGRRVLDLFAGAGALGLEAWSRGAEQVCWVEQDGSVYQQLKANVRALCGEDAARGCIRADAFAFIKRCREAYDFILADPPYAEHSGSFKCDRFLEMIFHGGCLCPGGRLILEQRSSCPITEHPDWTIAKNKIYGETRILFYALNR